MGLKIIAELAQGFEGNPKQAILLMRAAAKAGADASKYQMVYADELATPDYQHYNLFKSLEMLDSDWGNLANLAKSLNIELHLDIFGVRSLELAQIIGAQAIKLHGTDVANIGLLKQVNNCNIKTIYLGAGGAQLDEIEIALGILSDKQVIALVGFQGYPTNTEDNQVSRVNSLLNRFEKNHNDFSVGFSDHAEPNSIMSYAIGAIAIGSGATVIEKHLTLGRVLELEDYEAALNPDEFSKFVAVMRDCYQALGSTSLSNNFNMSDSELTYRRNIRRHVVAKKYLDGGKTINDDDVVLKRTSSKHAVNDLGLVYKKTLKKAISQDAPITLSDLD